MNFVFLMDPLETVVVKKDTTFLLMLGAQAAGHKVYFLPSSGISQLNGRLRFDVLEVTVKDTAENPFPHAKDTTLSEDDVDVLFIRTDPPFDGEYLLNTWLLDQFAVRKTVINHPAGIRSANEKIWATQFASVIPPTLISRSSEVMQEFLMTEKNVIAKPTDGFGGQSVFHFESGDTNAKVILETLSLNFKRDIVLQKYIPESQNGDKRILLLNGEPLGAVLRVHAQDDHRNNFFSGGKPLASEISKRDREVIELLKPELLKAGLFFVGIDILGDYLIEVNVTSPTCLREMNVLYGQQLEKKIIKFAEDCITEKTGPVTA